MKKIPKEQGLGVFCGFKKWNTEYFYIDNCFNLDYFFIAL